MLKIQGNRMVLEEECESLTQSEKIYTHIITHENFEGVYENFGTFLEQISLPDRKKLYSLFVESLQNALRYGIDLPHLKSVFCFLKKNDVQYVFVTGNPIEKEKKQKLTQTIDLINSLSDKTIDKLYFHILESDFFTEGGGAGLGLLDMKRKSGYRKIDYRVKEYDGYAYFYLILEYHIRNNV
jgi:hypothetical protein